MKTKIQNSIKEYNMCYEDDSILIGLSGGADSVALLFMMKELGYKVSACHINHQLRGEESDRDENFCRELCDKLGVELFVEKLDVKKFCEENKKGTEEGARILRYQTFDKYCGEGKIATAHTLSDNIETFLINFTRGATLTGLCAIPPKRGNIIRPLINCTREEIEEYLAEKGENFVTDSTNLTTDYTRNKIRHNIIPLLREINPSLEKSFSKSVTSLRDDNRFLDSVSHSLFHDIAQDVNTFDAELLKRTQKPIAFRIIAQILKHLNLECNREKIESIYDLIHKDGKYNISGNVYAIAKKGKLIISYDEKTQKEEFEQVIDFENSFDFMGKTISFEKGKIEGNTNLHKKFTKITLDYDKIQGKAFVRNRRDGDRIKFSGRAHTTSIKKLFNKDIDLDKRDKIAFICDDSGVIFVEGYGIAQRVAPDKNTKNIVIVNITEGNV